MRQTTIFLALVLALFSCKDYLDIKPYGLTVPKTAEEFSALIQNHLNAIDQGEDKVIIGNSNITYWDLVADNFESSLASSNGQLLPFYVGDKENISGYSSTEYEALYEVIRDCNIVIGDMPKDSELATKVLATAHALRGVCYYQLLRLYCNTPITGKWSEQLGVPLVLSFNMEAKVPRSNIQQLIDQIEQDYNKALSYNVNDDDYRFTPDVIRGYQARLYFWTQQWDKAEKTAKTLLQSHPLLFPEEYKKMLSTPIMTGNILIKSYRYSVGDDVNQQLQAGLTGIPLSIDFLSLFTKEEQEKDIRYMIEVGKDRLNAKGIIPCMRSAEFVLIAAEAAYHLGHKDEALALINKLRDNRITDNTPLTMNVLPAPSATGLIQKDATGASLTPLMALILNERRKELYLEGDRFYELKRNGSPYFWKARDGYKYETHPFMYTFPIPVKDVYLQKGMIQNPEYDKYTIGK